MWGFKTSWFSSYTRRATKHDDPRRLLKTSSLCPAVAVSLFVASLLGCFHKRNLFPTEAVHLPKDTVTTTKDFLPSRTFSKRKVRWKIFWFWDFDSAVQLLICFSGHVGTKSCEVLLDLAPTHWAVRFRLFPPFAFGSKAGSDPGWWFPDLKTRTLTLGPKLTI